LEKFIIHDFRNVPTMGLIQRLFAPLVETHGRTCDNL